MRNLLSPPHLAADANDCAKIAKRNPVFDLLKTWAIFLVILQHCISSLGWGMEMMNTPVGKAITMFNMPLFIFITGYFSKSSMERKFNIVLNQKWVTMLRPMLIFTIGLIVLKILYNSTYIEEPIRFMKFIVISILTTYWFIWIAVLCVLYSRLVYYVSRKRNRVLMLIVSWIVLMLIPRSYYIPFVVNLQAMYPFFVAGLIASENGMIEHLQRYKWSAFTIFSVIFIWQYIGFTGSQSFYYFTPMPLKEWLANYWTMLLCGFSGIVLSFVMFSKVPDCSFMKRLVYYGQYTFLIYMLQQYFVFFFMESGLHILGFGAELAIAVAVYCFIVVIVKAIRKDRILSLYLMGKRL